MHGDKHVFNSRARWQAGAGARSGQGAAFGPGTRPDYARWQRSGPRRRGAGEGRAGGLSHINDEIIVSIAFNCCQCKFYANIFRLALDS